ncbi:hypothetical protein MGYG_09048 [Nannizzia gypsea CBS 118893]|uniref:Uncharacterized protein n=1 Tax=Arthroderma gypseum (strain ATCC MYA-4604 / CBS 118893) TaxID=535722 RepID=E4UTG9_ARTGP|nr:hypothetical protein MGYG_09048 [Nannizzia gypsea CBS 118893]EFR01514.1 hypothetical protein MGYG_09048 [Nannizzia gypsea CBS 118893]
MSGFFLEKALQKKVWMDEVAVQSKKNTAQECLDPEYEVSGIVTGGSIIYSKNPGWFIYSM